VTDRHQRHRGALLSPQPAVLHRRAQRRGRRAGRALRLHGLRRADDPRPQPHAAGHQQLPKPLHLHRPRMGCHPLPLLLPRPLARTKSRKIHRTRPTRLCRWHGAVWGLFGAEWTRSIRGENPSHNLGLQHNHLVAYHNLLSR
jgi:hypothetical protein